MFLLKKIRITFFPIAFLCFPVILSAQQIDPHILELRAHSVANIYSMIAGTDQDVSSPLQGIPIHIKETNPVVFYDYVLQQKKDEIFNKLEVYGVNASEIKKIQENRSLAKTSSPVPNIRGRGIIKKMRSTALQRKVKRISGVFTDKSIPLIKKEIKYTPAEADDSSVYVNENNMKKYKTNAQDFLFGHEIQHLLGKHASEETLIKRYLEKKYDQLTASMQIDLKQLSRCNETIADVKTVVIGGMDFAKGYEGFAKQAFEAESDPAQEINAINSDHPSIRHRYNQAELLKEELELFAKLHNMNK